MFDVNVRNGLLKGKNFLEGCDADAAAGFSQPIEKRKHVLIAVKKTLDVLRHLRYHPVSIFKKII